jgi:hypothetical protein
MDNNKFDPAEIIKKPTLSVGGSVDAGLEDGVGDLTDEEWDEITKLQGQNRPDGTVITREEAIEQIKENRKK